MLVLLDINRSLEVDLSTLTFQKDYEEARIELPKYADEDKIVLFRMINTE